MNPTPTPEPEHRSAFVASVDRVEVRKAQDDSGDYTLTGHAAVFNRWSEELRTFAGTFREKIAPGAFTDVLKRNPDVRLLFNHDGMTLARTKAGTLELSEDDEGLRVWAKLAPTTQASDLRLAMQRGDIDQMSFAFTIAEDEWREDTENEEVERTVVRVGDLFDVSVVSYPAYPDTDAVMRDLNSAREAGKIAAPAEDPAGEQPEPTSAPAETDPVVGEERDASEQAETDPAVGGNDALLVLQMRARETAQEAREGYLRILKEIGR